MACLVFMFNCSRLGYKMEHVRCIGVHWPFGSVQVERNGFYLIILFGSGLIVLGSCSDHMFFSFEDECFIFRYCRYNINTCLLPPISMFVCVN